MAAITRIIRNEAWQAAGTHQDREKSAPYRGQSVAAFARDAVLAVDWFSPVDSVAMRLSKVLAESHGLTQAATLTRTFSHVALAAVAAAAAEVDRAKSVAFTGMAFVWIGSTIALGPWSGSARADVARARG